MVNANENCYTSHYAGPLSLEFVWFPKVAVNAGIQQANNSCCCPAARGHPPGGGEEGGNHFVGKQSHVPLDLQQVQHQGHESTDDEEDHAPLHQVLTQVQGAAAGGGAGGTGAGGAGAACSGTHQRQRGAGDGGAQHLAHLGGQPSGRVPQLGVLPSPGSAGAAPGAALQPGHWLRPSPQGAAPAAASARGGGRPAAAPPPPPPPPPSRLAAVPRPV